MASTTLENSAFSEGIFNQYRLLPGVYDELFDSHGKLHPAIGEVILPFESMTHGRFRRFQRQAEQAFARGGVTFSVYSDKRGRDRIFPFDLIPRVFSSKESIILEQGLKQRMKALNAFLLDIYGPQRILIQKVIPREIIESSTGYLPQIRGVIPPGETYIHVSGVDVIRDENGEFLVLEDNLRTPSGVSYVLENRFMMRRLFPQIFNSVPIVPVEQYPSKLKQTLSSLLPRVNKPFMVLLTPGPYNSAYFEHTYLARKMGCPLVQGQDLFVKEQRVFLKTTKGPQPVDIIYRRIDDEYLDPTVFNPESLLGVPNLMDAYACGNVVIANAIGNGVADDKAVYPYVPDMIRFYLQEEPLLKQVPTLLCCNPEDRTKILDDLSKYVIKATGSSGGYGMLFGATASDQERMAMSKSIMTHPREYIAQPIVEFSTCPTKTGNQLTPCRVDFRPFVLTGQESWMMPGGLTRVALEKNSYIVNSCQGGGSKDTWFVSD